MLSGTVLKQFRTYLKSQVGHGWSVEGRKSKGRLLTRVSFRNLSGERSVILLDIDFNAEYQDDIVRTVRKLSDLMRASNTDLINSLGSDPTEAVKHYITFGYSQGKVTNSFDATAYLNNYADLRNAFGDNQSLATKHYVEYGFNEGRLF